MYRIYTLYLHLWKNLPIMQTVGDGVPDVPRRVYEAEGYIFAIVNPFSWSVLNYLYLWKKFSNYAICRGRRPRRPAPSIRGVRLYFYNCQSFLISCIGSAYIIYIFENKFFYKWSIYSERSTLFWISRDRNFLCMTLPYNIFGALCLSDSVMNGTASLPSPYRNAVKNINITQQDVEDAIPYRKALQGI